MKRRGFIALSLTLTAGLLATLRLFWKQEWVKRYKVLSEDDHSALGHQLRGVISEKPSFFSQEELLIIGGGVAGLTAAMTLSQAGFNNYRLLELGSETGGNAIGGKNAISEFPWAAHYLPLPNKNQKAMLEFLHRADVIKSFNEDGEPEYNEYHLCFEPEERLFFNGNWRKGIIQDEHLHPEDKKALKDFFYRVRIFRGLKGADGREAFCIPVDFSSHDEEFRRLDRISMADWLKETKLNTPFMNWYIQYCCLDDYGASSETVSAWAGLHYFASRKGRGLNAQSHQMLTWPEGNHFLVKALREEVKGKSETETLVYSIEKAEEGYKVLLKNRKAVEEVKAKQVILCVPQYVAGRLLKGSLQRPPEMIKAFNYQPWLVSNISVKTDVLKGGHEGLSWDNVIFGSTSLGYVNACHQTLKTHLSETVITHYQPLGLEPAAQARQKLYAMQSSDVEKLVLNDLKPVHPLIESGIREVRYRKWGHGMVCPQPGFIFGKERASAAESIDGSLHFAHSDLSGISIFEEAFYRGHLAAEKALKNLRV